MASGTVLKPPPQGPESSPKGVSEYDGFIETQLRKTRGYVRMVDIASSLTTLLVGMLAFFLIVSVIDHWVLPGGLGFWSRLVLFLGLFGGTLYWFIFRVIPLILYRINPIYAARTIEQSEPSLKNSLINYLLFRANPLGLHQQVYRVLEHRAASDLTHVPVESVVDRSGLIKTGYVLIGVLIACGLYLLFSPKDPLQTAGRVLMPWSDIEAPSRVTIQEVRQDPKNVFLGQSVTISALVQERGKDLKEDEPVMLYWSTQDKQIENRAVRMYVSGSRGRHRCTLPDVETASTGKGGLQQSITYRIEAGDAKTELYEIKILSNLYITVHQVQYEYPKYTGKKSRTQQHGDIRALEGTLVTVHAEANQDIDKAWIDFDGTNEFMDVEGRKAKFTFQLRRHKNGPEHSTYSLHFSDQNQYQSIRPVHHTIEVVPDMKPELEFIDPKKMKFEMTPFGQKKFMLSAYDDFGLQDVRFLAQLQGKQALLADEPLLDEHLLLEKETPWKGKLPFKRQYIFRPGKLGLKPGDVVTVWATARDNKDPQPNLTTAPVNEKYEIRIIEPPPVERLQNLHPKKAPQNKQDPSKQPNDSTKPQEKEKKPDPGEKQEPGQQSDSKNESGQDDQSSQKQGNEEGSSQDTGQGQEQQSGKDGAPSRRIDPDNAPADALQKIRDHLKEQEEQEAKGQKDNNQQQSSDQQSSDQKDQGQQAGGKKSQGQSDQKQGTDQQTDDQKNAGQSRAQKKSPGQQAQSQEQSANQKDSSQKDGDPEGAKQPGADPEDTGKKGRGQEGAKKSGGEKDQSQTQEENKQGAEGSKNKQGQAPKESQGSGKKGQGPPKEKKKEKGGSGQSKKRKEKTDGGQKPDGKKPKPKNAQGNKNKSNTGNKSQNDSAGKKPGQGSPGQGTSANEGKAPSSEQGTGETSEKPGTEKKADRTTGNSNPSQKGEGSEAKSGKQGSGHNDAESDAAQSKQQGSPDQSQLGKKMSTDHKRGQSFPVGGGNQDRNEDEPNEPPEGGTESPADKVNLDYARKATDLAIDHLKDQLDKQDPSLLKQLDWTREEAQRFIDRWNKLDKDAHLAGKEGQEARKKRNEFLQGLGIRRQTAESHQSRDDQLRFDARRHFTPPPSKWKELGDFNKDAEADN